MGVFKKTSKYRKLSTISEKEKFLNAELIKTGMLGENAPANSTSGVYFATATTSEPVAPSVQNVPDTSGITAGASYTQAGGEGKPENGAWADPGYSDNSDLINNDGGNADGKPILNSPWNGLEDSDGNPSGAVGFGAYSSVWGTRFVTFMSDGTAWWPSNSDTSPAAEAARSYKDDFDWPPNGWNNPGWVWRAYWVPFSIYNPRIDAYWPGSGQSPEWNGIVKGSPGDSPMALLGAYIWTGDRAQYNDPGIPGTKVVLQRAGLGDADFFPGDAQQNRRREEEEAKEQLDVGDRAWDWLNDIAGDIGDAFADGWEDATEEGEEWVDNAKQVMNGVGEIANQVGVSAGEFVDSALEYAEAVGEEEREQREDNFKNQTVGMNYAYQIGMAWLTGQDINYGNDDIPQEQKENLIKNLNLDVTQQQTGGAGDAIPVNSQPADYCDDNFCVRTDSDGNRTIEDNRGEDGESSQTKSWLTNDNNQSNPLGTAGEFQLQIVIPEDGGEAYIQYDDNAYYNNQSSDKGEVPWWAKPGAAFVDAVGAVGNALGLGGDSEYPEGIQGNVSKSFTMSIEEAAELNPDLLKNPAVAEYLGIEDTSAQPQGNTQQQQTTQQQSSQQQQQQSSQSSQQQAAQQDKGGGEFIPNQFSDKSDAKISGSLISSLEHGELENVANEIGVDASRLQSAVEKVQELEADWKSAEGADAQIAANKILNKAVKELGAFVKSGKGSKDTKVAGAGGSPGQPYTPPKENPNNPWVPAPGKDTKVAGVSYPSSMPSGAYYGGEKQKQSDWLKKEVDRFDQFMKGPGGKFKVKNNKKKNKNQSAVMAASYQSQGKVLSEGWQSPEHVNVDKNERKRWFNPKDIKPEFPEKAPPEQVDGWHPDLKKKEDRQPCLLRQLMTRMTMKKGKMEMKDYIKIKEVDLLKNHRLKDKEIKEFMKTINAINVYLTRNPSALVHAQQRYPKSDPHLAALNFKMDTMLAASKEFMDKKYPENTRLFNQLQKSVKRSIKLTDPSTFKVKLGKETSYKKLLKVNYVENIYDKVSKTETKVKRKKNKKSIARFFRKEKPKTRMEEINMRIKQLEKDMI